MADKSVRGGHAKTEASKTLKEKRAAKADKKAAAERSEKTDVVAKAKKR